MTGIIYIYASKGENLICSPGLMTINNLPEVTLLCDLYLSFIRLNNYKKKTEKQVMMPFALKLEIQDNLKKSFM